MRDYKYAVFTTSQPGTSALRFYVTAMTDRDATIKAQAELIDRGLSDDGLRVMRAVLYLDVACNDPDNGIFIGRAQGLTIGDAEFMPRNWPRGYAFKEMGGAIRLAGSTWRVAGSKEWYGNWCWNRYELYHAGKTTRWYLVDFVKWLRQRRYFNCDNAPSEFFEWFENDEVQASDADVHRMICELESR